MAETCPNEGDACTDFETQAALLDAYCVAIEWGMSIVFRQRFETQVLRDRYNSVARYNVAESVASLAVDMRTYPAQFSPTTRDIEKSGLRERTEVIIYIPAKYFIDNNIDFERITPEFCTFDILGSVYEIRDKARQSQFRGVFLYYVFGLHKR